MMYVYKLYTAILATTPINAFMYHKLNYNYGWAEERRENESQQHKSSTKVWTCRSLDQSFLFYQNTHKIKIVFFHHRKACTMREQNWDRGRCYRICAWLLFIRVKLLPKLYLCLDSLVYTGCEESLQSRKWKVKENICLKNEENSMHFFITTIQHHQRGRTESETLHSK